MSDPNTKDVEEAFARLLAALGYERAGDTQETPKRAADLWLRHLVAGLGVDLPALVRDGICADNRQDPVTMQTMGVHMVCPHHLTVSFGHAHLAYQPAGRVVGFGALAALVEAATGQLVLQEDATAKIADALIAGLQARAVVVALQATHPCHNIVHPRSHEARAVTWAERGAEPDRAVLRALITPALEVNHG